MTKLPNLYIAIFSAQEALKRAEEVPVERWQAVSTTGHFKELVNYQFSVPIPVTQIELAAETNPNLPWAEDHFQERVSGYPLNPGKEYKNWPYWTAAAERMMKRVGGRFSHTYMERFWPTPNKGIRYKMNNLDAVVDLLVEEPYTRQAYVPIWFPEDTGARHHERVPCTLGYHFMLRGSYLHMWYFIRSVDFVHYLRDDIYMACRLCQWMIERCRKRDPGRYPWSDAIPGDLSMTICSLHVFGKDFRVLEES